MPKVLKYLQWFQQWNCHISDEERMAFCALLQHSASKDQQQHSAAPQICECQSVTVLKHELVRLGCYEGEHSRLQSQPVKDTYRESMLKLNHGIVDRLQVLQPFTMIIEYQMFINKQRLIKQQGATCTDFAQHMTALGVPASTGESSVRCILILTIIIQETTDDIPHSFEDSVDVYQPDGDTVVHNCCFFML